MQGFYKHYQAYLIEASVNPDKRRNMVPGEGPRHYIDLEEFKQPIGVLPRAWQAAIDTFTLDSLRHWGVVPWHIQLMKLKLTEAFKARNAREILHLSADIGHYIADSRVPLHTTSNHDGQLSNQKGLHSFWESRLPELYGANYNLMVGKAEYLGNVGEAAFAGVGQANAALDSVFRFERELTATFDPALKYTVEDRNGRTRKEYSEAFSLAYNTALGRQVERQMRYSTKEVADFWYTCWVDAGQPRLKRLMKNTLSKEELEAAEKEFIDYQKRLDAEKQQGYVGESGCPCLAWHGAH
jgi:hypothetical protein